jgi:hypothetical protein
MLKVPILAPDELDRAANIFHRDGFVCVKNILTPEQLKFAQAGAARVIKEQTDADPERKGNRGSYRYSFGPQTHHPEWTMLIDLPTLLPIIDKIWGSQDYTCSGAGGDYSLPKAELQGLHKDMGDFFNDPHAVVTHHDIPAPFIVVNFTMIDFTKENGAIRFIPCTQRSRHPIPAPIDEPEWMKDSIVCAPAGTAVVRDVRCWHGGTANNSTQIRPMTSVGYFAPWRRPHEEKVMTRELFNKLSPRGQKMCRSIVRD